MKRARHSIAKAQAAAPRKKRVLLVGLFHPELVRGGAQQILYELFQGLGAHTDTEAFLLCAIDSSYPSLYKSGARISGFDGRPNEFLYLAADYDYLWHKTGSPLHVAAFVEFLETVRPDVVHFHHFLLLGIDALTLTRKTLPAARIVFTFHEFMAICAADGHMLRTTDRSLCTYASPIRCHQCFPDRSPEQFLLRKMWFQRHLSVVDAFTCPSRFMVEPFVEWGLDRNKLHHVTNGQQPYGRRQPPPDRGLKRRFGFFGQMVDVKGLHLLLRAVELLRAEGLTGLTVDINGDNLRYASAPMRLEIEAFLDAEAARPPAERIVHDNGSYQVDQLAERMARVDWCVVPSVWWEIFGLVISEAWMFGKPVICANVGGMAERVVDESFGLHFQRGDVHSLARVLRRASTEDGLWEKLSAAVPPPPNREEMVEGYRRAYGTAFQSAVSRYGATDMTEGQTV